MEFNKNNIQIELTICGHKYYLEQNTETRNVCVHCDLLLQCDRNTKQGFSIFHFCIALEMQFVSRVFFSLKKKKPMNFFQIQISKVQNFLVTYLYKKL